MTYALLPYYVLLHTTTYLPSPTYCYRTIDSRKQSTYTPTVRNTVAETTTTLLNNLRYKCSTAISFSVFCPITLIGLLKELTRLTRLSYGRHCLRNKSFDKPTIVRQRFTTLALRLASSLLHSRLPLPCNQ